MVSFAMITTTDLPNLILLLAFIGITYFLSTCFYNVYLHPLRNFPGPRLYAASILPWTYHILRGDGTTTIMPKLYSKYGRTVRIAPNRIIFPDAVVWRDIHTYKTKNGSQNKKDTAKFQPQPNLVTTLDDDLHMRWRRIFSPAFSSRAIAAQEPLITKYVDLLIEALKEKCVEGPQLMTAWMNWTTFDIIGDLTFGESFGSLENRRQHPWVDNFFAHTKLGLISAHLRHNFRLFRWIEPYLHSTTTFQKRASHAAFTKDRVQKRWDQGETGRPDFMTLVWQEGGKEAPLSFDENFANAIPIVIAGSETTATTLSGCLYFLCRNPEKFTTLSTLLRKCFPKDSDIDSAALSRIDYLTAVIRETLRLYPPVPTESERLIISDQVIAGHFIPTGTYCGISAYAANRLPSCFTCPNDFIPERWLGEDERFRDDEREVSMPFSAGPRNCIGQNLAWMEMKLVLARLLWNFEFVLVNEDEDWVGSQKTYLLWEKVPLWMKVAAREGLEG